MSVPRFSQIKPGTLVSIVLKADQRTGRQVQGTVANTLTRGDHPRGVKVRLADGRIGRVQKLVEQGTTGTTAASQKPYRKMADQNPWASESHGNTGQQHSNQQQQQHQYGGASGGFPEQRFYDGYNQRQQQQSQPDFLSSPPQNTTHSQPDYLSSPQYNTSHSPNPSYGAYQPPPSNSNPWEDTPSSNPPLPARHPQHNFGQQQSQPQPFGAPHRRDTDDLLAAEPDRAEQVEHLQAYEATATQSKGDRDRAQLEKEFPNLDGSLIAALYGDTQDLSSTREMLQELGRD